MLLSESKITKAIDQSNYDEIVIDKDKERSSSITSWSKSSRRAKLAMQKSLIKTWRFYSRIAKVEDRLMEIYNEAVVSDETEDIIELMTKKLEGAFENESVNKKVIKTLPLLFSKIVDMLMFDVKGTEIFKKWYVDGGLYLYIEFDKSKKAGIKEIRFLDPLKLELVTEGGKTTYSYITDDEESFTTYSTETTIKLPTKNVIYIPSGLKSEEGIPISYLNKAVRPINMLHLMENSMVVHRFVRAPERLVFRIDVSGMNKKKAKAYMRNLRSKYRSKYTINGITGEMNSQNVIMSMQENYWLPKTNSNNGGHDIDTIGGSQSLSEGY